MASRPYLSNYLARRLRQPTLGRNDSPFLIADIRPPADGPDGFQLTFGQFFGAAETFAARLRELGVRPGDRVAACVGKSPAALELYMGSLLAGAVFLPLNPAFTPPEMRYFVDDADPVLLVCETTRYPDLAPVAEGGGTTRVLTLGPNGEGSFLDGLDHRSDTGTSEFLETGRRADDLAALLYTSGTTGRPKGTMLTHDNLASNAETLTGLWQFTASDRLIHALPIFHVHGLFVATHVALMAGARLLFLPKFEVRAVIDCMPEATALMGVPTFYTRLLEQPDLPDAASSMRLFISGSAPLLARTHVAWKRATGHAIIERYGMTETGMNTSNPHDGERRAGTVGPALPGVGVRLGAGNVLEVAGPNVFPGYWRRPEANAESFTADGYFVTGDIASIGPDGYVTIIGRSRDLVISGGYNIYPAEIEPIIDVLPGVSESAVIGVPHPDLGEAAVAVVVREPKSGAGEDPVSEDGILAGAARQLAPYKRPRRILFREHLPRNVMGKVLKNRLRDDYGDLFAD
ncbi:MAG: AMP-binding protein [Paracoccaceae bacterium]|nr:AMP-binding protein [Paracoccaceae bacterium]